MEPEKKKQVLMDLSQNVRLHRSLMGIGKVKLANELNIAADTLRRLEAGIYAPNLILLLDLTDKFNLDSVEELFMFNPILSKYRYQVRKESTEKE